MNQPFYGLALGDEVPTEFLPGDGIDLSKLNKEVFGTAPLSGRWRVLTIRCLEEQPLPDLFEWSSRSIVSERFRRLCDGFRVNAEFLPMNVLRPDGKPASDQPCWFLHPLERIDCIDYDASVYEIYGTKDDFTVRRFSRLVMRPEAIGDRDLFRPDRYPALYVSEKLRDAILRAKLSVGFRELEGQA